MAEDFKIDLPEIDFSDLDVDLPKIDLDTKINKIDVPDVEDNVKIDLTKNNRIDTNKEESKKAKFNALSVSSV